MDVITIHPPYVGNRELRELPDEIRRFEPKESLTDFSPMGMGLIQRVATDLGCWMELCVALGTITTAGEMNGFLKTPVQLLVPALKCDGPAVVVDGSARNINMEAVNRYACERIGRWNDCPSVPP